MAKTKATPRIRTPDERLAEGTLEGNIFLALSPQRPRVEVLSASSSFSSAETSLSSSSDGASADSSFGGSSCRSSLGEASTSSSTQAEPNALGRVVLKKRGRTLTRTVPKVMAKGLVFPDTPFRSNLQDGPGTHFPNPKVVPSLKRMALEKKYLLFAGYSFVIPEPDATVNKPPSNCIVIYRVAFNYGVRFPLHPVNVEIFEKIRARSYVDCAHILTQHMLLHSDVQAAPPYVYRLGFQPGPHHLKSSQ